MLRTRGTNLKSSDTLSRLLSPVVFFLLGCEFRDKDPLHGSFTQTAGDRYDFRKTLQHG